MGEPVGNTCPDIDSAIKAINNAEKLCTVSGYETEDDLRSVLTDIEWELRGLESTLEDLRTANAKLREWGTERDEEADSLASEILDKQDEINGLETKNAELQNEVDNMEIA